MGASCGSIWTSALGFTFWLRKQSSSNYRLTGLLTLICWVCRKCASRDRLFIIHAGGEGYRQLLHRRFLPQQSTLLPTFPGAADKINFRLYLCSGLHHPSRGRGSQTTFACVYPHRRQISLISASHYRRPISSHPRFLSTSPPLQNTWFLAADILPISSEPIRTIARDVLNHSLDAAPSVDSLSNVLDRPIRSMKCRMNGQSNCLSRDRPVPRSLHFLPSTRVGTVHSISCWADETSGWAVE